MLAATPTMAQPVLYREPDGNVVLKSADMAMRFHVRYGGAPLQVYKEGFPSLLEEHAGAGWQTAVRVGGNDPTQASANGPMEYPIAVFGRPETDRYNFYGRESEFNPTALIYETRSFMPDYWLSGEPHDDAAAPNPDGSFSGWRTPYQAGWFASVLASPSRPVIFEGGATNFSGLFFVGDETAAGSPWPQRLRRYQDGRVAIKTRISLSGAPDTAFAGIVFRKSVPAGALDKHAAYVAPGLHLFVNKRGGYALTRMNPSGGESTLHSGTLSQTERRKLEGVEGLVVEARTHNTIPGYVEIWLDGRIVAAPRDDYALTGEHVGLFANTSSGYVVFNDRQVVDVGIEVVSRYSAWNGGIVSDVVVRNAPGVTKPHAYDRANLPGIFLSKTTFHEADREIATVHVDETWPRLLRIEPVVAGSFPVSSALGFWAGNSAGTAGILGIPEIVTVDGQPSPGAHVFMKTFTEDGEFVLMFNPLPKDAVTEARELRMRIRWATSL